VSASVGGRVYAAVPSQGAQGRGDQVSLLPVDIRGGLPPGALAGNRYAVVKRTGGAGAGAGSPDMARMVGADT